MATDLLTLRYTPLDELSEAFLQGNPKRHDLGQLWDSMQRYGFRDPMAFDAQLNGGKGGIVEGNGRLETLVSAYNNDQLPPRGIKLDEDGRWFVPVLYGVDGRSESEAIAYSFDHNTMVLSGGEFTALDASKLYDAEGYTALLQELANAESLPLTVDGEDLDLLIQQLGGGIEDNDGTEYQPGESQDFSEDAIPESSVRMAQLFLDTETHPLFLEMVEGLNLIYGTDNPTDCVMAGLRELCENHAIDLENG